MKKTACIILCLTLLTVCLSGCNDSFSIYGLANYDRNVSMFSTCGFLPNGEKLWEKYEYIDGDFFYSYVEGGVLCMPQRETALLYLTFEDDAYEAAKEYTLSYVEMSDNGFWYNNYCFCEGLPKHSNTSSLTPLRHPRHFLQTIFNDEKRTILFIGFWITSSLNAEEEQIINRYAEGDVQPFLEKYFPMYDFSE